MAISKEKQINIRVSDEEKKYIIEKAKSKDMKISDYARSKLLDDENSSISESYTKDIQMYRNKFEELSHYHQQILESAKIKDETIQNLIAMLDEEHKKTTALSISLEEHKSRSFMTKLKELFKS